MNKKNNTVDINKTKIRRIVFLLISSIGIMSMVAISGCINPFQEVPVIKVNVTFTEKQGIVDTESYTLTPGHVIYLNRPKKTQADSFPAIAARVTLKDNKSVTIGPWEMVPYNGTGVYTFNIGFMEGHYPVNDSSIHVSIMVVDKTGQKIGYIIDNIKWKESK